jgi:hypothetical protein
LPEEAGGNQGNVRKDSQFLGSQNQGTPGKEPGVLYIYIISTYTSIIYKHNFNEHYL